MSGDDAKAPVRELAASGEGPPTAEQAYDIIIPASELQNLPDYNLYIRTLLAGQPLEPFLVQGFPPFSKSGKKATANRVITTRSRRYERDRQAVEKILNRFLST